MRPLMYEKRKERAKTEFCASEGHWLYTGENGREKNVINALAAWKRAAEELHDEESQYIMDMIEKNGGIDLAKANYKDFYVALTLRAFFRKDGSNPVALFVREHYVEAAKLGHGLSQYIHAINLFGFEKWEEGKK